MNRLTAIFTSLTPGGAHLDQTEIGVSSLMDTWLVVRNLESGGERNRALYVLKARGLAHSNQVREFVLSKHGIELIDVYAGGDEVLVGSARLAQEAREKEEAIAKRNAQELRRRNLERRRKIIEAQIVALRAELEAEESEARVANIFAQQQEARSQKNRGIMSRIRSADPTTTNGD